MDLAGKMIQKLERKLGWERPLPDQEPAATPDVVSRAAAGAPA
jgi:hypothetical protein